MSAKKSGSESNVKRFRLSMVFGYTAMIVCIIIIISALVLNKTDDILKSKVSEMTSLLNVQMRMNMNSYLSKLETSTTLVFANEEVYTYIATDGTADGYDAIQTENLISDELFSLSLMENFVDFGMVYENNHTVGKVTNGTVDLFGDKLYSDLSAMINRQRTLDGWSAGYHGDFTRIYYVKRINEGAVLVMSFYTTELDEVFEHPGGLNDITVRLADSNNSVIYSSVDDDEVGSALPAEITSRIQEQTSATVIDDEYLVTVNSCGDDWKVICSVPTQIILKEKNDVTVYIVIVAIVASLFAFCMSLVLSRRISNPLDDMLGLLTEKANLDSLTHLLNKRSFEEAVGRSVKAANEGDRLCMLLIDMDNLKTINDELGNEAGDKALVYVANAMSRLHGSEGFLARLDSDEFCILLEIPKTADSLRFADSKCSELCRAFNNSYADKDRKHKISVSVGAVCAPANTTSFIEMHDKAGEMLQKSKEKGKNTFSIFTEEEK